MSVINKLKINGEYYELLPSDIDLVQTTGSSETAVMSQKAVSDLLKFNPLEGETWDFASFFDVSDMEDGLDYGWSGHRTDRMSIKKVLCLSCDIGISVKEGYKYTVVRQSAPEVDPKNFVSTTGWVTGATKISAGDYFIVLLAKTVGSTMTMEDAKNIEFSSVFTQDSINNAITNLQNEMSGFQNDIVNLEETQQSLIEGYIENRGSIKDLQGQLKCSPLNGMEWELGTFLAPGEGPYGFDYSNIRIIIKKALCFPYDVHVSVNPFYKYFIVYQSAPEIVESNFISETGWITEDTTIPAGQHFVICLALSTNGVMDTSRSRYITVTGYPTLDERFESFAKDLNISDSTNAKIVEKNKDVKHIIQAACNYGRNNTEGNEWARAYKKCLTFLVSTDFHSDTQRVKNMVEYLNNSAEIDAGINLGDNQLLRYGDNDGTWYTDVINTSQKEFYTVLGNHDVGMDETSALNGTPDLSFNKLIKPTLSKIGLSGLTTPYYAKTFDRYKTVVVFLNTYDAPDSKDGSGNYIVPRYCEMFSQAQIDWFINTLASIPAGYHLVVAGHSIGFENEVVDSNFSHKNRDYVLEMAYPYGHCTIIPDIINVWKKGGTLSETYAPNSYLGTIPTLTANCNFASRGAGNFVCFLVGHQHTDLILECKKYQDQKIVSLTTSACLETHYCDSDLTRVVGEKSEDALTVFSVDTDARQIRLVRVGSNFSCDMVDRTFTTIDY